jgi:peptide-methionine (R)-S-oxide reductase
MRALLLAVLAGTLLLVAASDRGSSSAASESQAVKTTSTAAKKGAAAKPAASDKIVKITKTDEQWKKQLTPEQYRVLRESGTERAFTGKYWDNHAAGTYLCAACGLDLFDSKTKFESGRAGRASDRDQGHVERTSTAVSV